MNNDASPGLFPVGHSSTSGRRFKACAQGIGRRPTALAIILPLTTGGLVTSVLSRPFTSARHVRIIFIHAQLTVASGNLASDADVGRWCCRRYGRGSRTRIILAVLSNREARRIAGRQRKEQEKRRDTKQGFFHGNEEGSGGFCNSRRSTGGFSYALGAKAVLRHDADSTLVLHSHSLGVVLEQASQATAGTFAHVIGLPFQHCFLHEPQVQFETPGRCVECPVPG